MTAFTQLPRRSFLGLALGISGGVVAGAMPAMAALTGKRPVLVYDDAAPAARRFAATSHKDFAQIRAIKGDRIRFTRALVAERPDVVTGVTRYPDFLMITGTAEETGYRVIAQTRRQGGRPALIAWTMRRR
ncbi:MAG TPA: hypothetical protein VKA19_12765 [Alphaproteobacteria bacterium]|nr:hypothetical protein [Alphaproteobacteria bacterium]